MHSFQLGLQSDACRRVTMVTPRRNYISLDVVGRQRLQSSSTSHRRVAEPQRQDRLPNAVLAEISLYQRWRERHVVTLATSSVPLHVLCSNFNYKPQADSRQQHLALYMECHLLEVTVMVEVTCRQMECTHFNLDNSRMPAVAQHHQTKIDEHN